jgi:MFS family permease
MFWHHKKTFKDYLSLKEVSPVVKFFTLSDVVIGSGFGLVAPIFAIFITDNIPNGSLAVVGIAQTIYLITKSLGQIPVARIIDKIKGELDDYWVMFIGTIFISLVPIAYLFVGSVFSLYVVQFVYGLALAATYPTWMAIFTRHIDKHKEGFEWGVYLTLTDLSGALTAGLGGWLAEKYGFEPLFVLVAILSLLGSFTLLYVYKEMKKK